MPRAVMRRAHAKINVFLRVLGRRADGFHDLESVILPISMYDVVTATDVGSDRGGISLQVEGEPELTGLVSSGELEDNLAGRAAIALAERVGGAPGAVLRLDKRIPIMAGLGGGSADAAATLEALNDLWACGFDARDLSEIGATIGSDVPAMLAGEPALASGRGERLTPVHAATTWWVLKPFGFGVSAADAYGWWDEEPTTGPDSGVLIAALETGDVELLGNACFNDLQPPVVSRHPEVGATIDAFLAAGACGAIMSGSGPTVASLARNIGHVDALAAAVPGSIVVSGPPARSRHEPS